jgi:hypothetical protein
MTFLIPASEFYPKYEAIQVRFVLLYSSLTFFAVTHLFSVVIASSRLVGILVNAETLLVLTFLFKLVTRCEYVTWPLTHSSLIMGTQVRSIFGKWSATFWNYMRI